MTTGKEHRQVDTTNQLNAPNAADGNISTHEQNFSLSSPMTPPNTHNCKYSTVHVSVIIVLIMCKYR